MNKLRIRYPEVIKKKGRGLIIKIENNGKCSKPCKMCWKLLLKIIPYSKIIYIDHNKDTIKSSLNNIREVSHSYGTRVCNH